MKKLIAEFKTFITRGNVIDLATGMIIGSAFTAIVNALSKQIIQPLINWFIYLVSGGESLEQTYTMLVTNTKSEVITDELGVQTTQEVIDYATSIYIDWGALITAIINFILIAIVLFTIIKFFNNYRKAITETRANLKKNLDKATLNKEEKKELKAAGVNIKDKDAVKAYFAEKAAKEEAQKLAEEEAKKLAEEEAKANSTEALLKDIKNILLAQRNNQ
jgi:large conductance mechanosensitive channel